MTIDYSDFIHNSDGSFSKKVNLISIHFKKFSNYREDWKIEHIIHFEAMLVLARGFPEKFFYQQKNLSEMTNLSSHIIRKCKERLVNMGFLEVSRGGENNKNWYSVNYQEIKDNLHKIYDFSNLDENDKEGYKEMMKRFFDYYQEYNHTAISEYKNKKEEDDEIKKLKSTPLVAKEVEEDVEYADSGFEDLPDEMKQKMKEEWSSD